MLISCWGYHPEQRPSVNEMIEIMTGSECLITPCLNAPKESVALEMQESLDIVPLRQCGHKYRQGLRTPSDHIQNAHDSRIFSHSPTSMSGGATEPFLFPPLGAGSALPNGGHGVVLGIPGTMNNIGVGGGSLMIVERRTRLNSDNQQSEEGRTLETLSDGSGSDSEPDLTTACLSQNNKSRHTGHSHGESSQSRRTSMSTSSKSSSPDSPIQLRYVALPHDSDYSSSNSKELWTLNGTSAV